MLPFPTNPHLRGNRGRFDRLENLVPNNLSRARVASCRLSVPDPKSPDRRFRPDNHDPAGYLYRNDPADR